MVDKTCLSGEGRGRIKYQMNRKMFRYESVNNLKNNSWGLALHIPVYGEELMRIFWGNSIKSGKFKIQGKFYRRLQDQNGNKQAKELAYLNHSLGNLALFINFISDFQAQKISSKLCSRVERGSDYISGNCLSPSGKQLFNWKLSSDKYVITFPNSNGYQFFIELFDEASDRFARMRIALEEDGMHGDQRYPFELDLFVDRCAL